MQFPKIRLAVSDCLRGTECRYNGGHAQSLFVKDELAQFSQFFPFCPEAAVMGTPRETIRLVEIGDQIRIIGPKSGTDYTEGLQVYNQKMVGKLASMNLDGAVVKAKSPSCGLERIKVYQPNGEWHGSKDPMTDGRFTHELRDQLPYLAIEDEGRLQDAWLRENFVLQLFTSARWREFKASEPQLAEFQAFHRDHKYLLLSKSTVLYRQMGSVVAHTLKDNLVDQLEVYQDLLYQALAIHSKRGQMINTLDHIYGYFKKQLTPAEKQHYQDSVSEFRLGVVPLIAVIKVLEQFLKHYGSDYLANQVFFHPYPPELALRSKISAYRR